MIIPPINTKGLFTVQSPFEQMISDKQEYVVTAIRSLSELLESNEKPIENIYAPVGLTEVEYTSDLNSNIPIIILLSSSSKYIYVPANRILTVPNISGFRYQEKVLGINLGSIPTNLYLTDLINELKATVTENIGINTDVKIIDSSAVILIDEVDHLTFTAKRESRIANELSYKTLYEQQLILINKLRDQISELECYIISKEDCN